MHALVDFLLLPFCIWEGEIFFVEFCYGFALILLQDLVHAYLVWCGLLEVENM